MKDIVGYEGLYGIEEDGRVWSYRSNMYYTSQIHKCGYYYVSLRDGNQKKNNYLIHRLIAITYIPNPDNKPFIDHINRIRTDNRIENLRWVTSCENNQNMPINNTDHNIYYSKNRDTYRVRIERNNTTHNKYFKTKQEAIDYRDNYLKTISPF
jgi:hypothetical protein